MLDDVLCTVLHYSDDVLCTILYRSDGVTLIQHCTAYRIVIFTWSRWKFWLFWLLCSLYNIILIRWCVLYTIMRCSDYVLWIIIYFCVQKSAVRWCTLYHNVLLCTKICCSDDVLCTIMYFCVQKSAVQMMYCVP